MKKFRSSLRTKAGGRRWCGRVHLAGMPHGPRYAPIVATACSPQSDAGAEPPRVPRPDVIADDAPASIEAPQSQSLAHRHRSRTAGPSLPPECARRGCAALTGCVCSGSACAISVASTSTAMRAAATDFCGPVKATSRLVGRSPVACLRLYRDPSAAAAVQTEPLGFAAMNCFIPAVRLRRTLSQTSTIGPLSASWLGRPGRGSRASRSPSARPCGPGTRGSQAGIAGPV